VKISAYSEKLKDPRWQKKRLKILERDNWECRVCGDNKSALHVHHRYYLPNTEVWDYPDEALITLCEDCHEIEKEDIFVVIDRIKFVLQSKFLSYDISGLAEALYQLNPAPVGVNESVFQYIFRQDNFDKAWENFSDELARNREVDRGKTDITPETTSPEEKRP
jgi:hypothetical protein